MTYKDFISVDKSTQIDVTLEEGIIVGRRHEHDDFLKIFHMGTFYVELRYLEDQSEVIAIVHSDKDDLLEPSLTAINISWLV